MSAGANVQALSNALRRLVANLRVTGVAVTFDQRVHGGKRPITAESLATASTGNGRDAQLDEAGNPASPASPPVEKPLSDAEDRGDEAVTQTADGDATVAG